MLDLRRLAWDLSLFTTAEFGFVALPAQYTTGSSIMPNKRNPDVIELMRGSYASVAAARCEIEQLLSLPSGYHRDLQVSKGALVHGFGAGWPRWRCCRSCCAACMECGPHARRDRSVDVCDGRGDRPGAGMACRFATPTGRRRIRRAGRRATLDRAWPRACPPGAPAAIRYWTYCVPAWLGLE